MALAVAIAREMREASFIVSIVLFCELEGSGDWQILSTNCLVC